MRTSKCPHYDWMPWSGFVWFQMCIHVDETVLLLPNYDWMPCGGFGGIWISLHVDSSFHIQQTATGCRGAGLEIFAYAFMWRSQTHCKSYDWMPWGGFGGIWSSRHGDESFRLHRTTTGRRGAGGVGLRFPFMWIHQSNCKTQQWMPWGGFVWIWIRMSLYEDFQLPKLRLDAVGRVWWDLDVPSCG